MFFLFIIGTAWAETIVESSYYYLVGVSHLSQVFVLHALLSLIVTAVYSAFADRISNQKLLVVVCGIAVLAICGALLLIGINQILAYTALYVLVRAVRTSFVIHWWNYASDYYDAHAAKRIIPVINSGSRLAIILAGLTIPLLNLLLSPIAIILLWVATLLMVAGLSWLLKPVIKPGNGPKNFGPEKKQNIISGNSKIEHSSYLSNISEGFKYVSTSNYLRWVALSTFLMVIIFAILNYQGGLIFQTHFATRGEITNFIGTLNGLTSLLMLPVQLFLFSRIIAKIGVGNANVLFPLGTFLISSGVLYAPLSLGSGALAHFDRNTFRYSIQESSSNLLYNAVPARVKGRARSFVDGLVLPVALLVSSALLEFGKLLPGDLFLPVLLGLPALAFLLCSMMIRKLYARAMIALLEQEDYVSLLPSDNNLVISIDPATQNNLLMVLSESQDNSITLLLVRIMAEADINLALPIIEKKAKESDAILRAGIIGMLTDADLQERSLQHFYVSFLRDEDQQVRLAAFLGLQQIEESPSLILDLAVGLLSDVSPHLRAEALVLLFKSNNPTYIAQGETALQLLLNDPDPQARASAIDALGKTGEARFLPILLAHLNDADGDVRLHSILVIEARLKLQSAITSDQQSAIIAAAETLLHDPLARVRLAALTMLEQVHSINSCDLIVNSLFDPAREVREKAGDLLVDIGDSSAPVLKLALANNPQQSAIIKAVLCRINPRQYGSLVDEQIRTELKNIYQRYALINDLRDFPAMSGVLFLRSLLAELNHDSQQMVFQLLSARYGEKLVERIQLSLAAGKSAMQANASEALDALVDSSLSKLIQPILENSPPLADLLQIGATVWKIKLLSPELAIRTLLTGSQNEWLRAGAIYVVGEISAAAKTAQTPSTTGSGEPISSSLLENRRGKRINLMDILIDNESANTQDAQAKQPAGPTRLFPDALADELIISTLEDPSHEVRAAARAAENMARMGITLKGELMSGNLSIIERIIFLKQVTFFKNMSVDQLKVLANICEEQSVPADTRIFQEGEPGGVVYVVVKGRVAIEREGDRKDSVIRLSTIEARSSFGEMSLFDDRPRSASALSLEDCTLLALRVEHLMALIRQYPDMSLELIKILSLRVREANDQIAHLTRSMPRKLRQVYDQLEDLGGA
jgi:CRP-like cAMP-binding protein